MSVLRIGRSSSTENFRSGSLRLYSAPTYTWNAAVGARGGMARMKAEGTSDTLDRVELSTGGPHRAAARKSRTRRSARQAAVLTGWYGMLRYAKLDKSTQCVLSQRVTQGGL